MRDFFTAPDRSGLGSHSIRGLFPLLCLLICGCATRESKTLTENQFDSLKHTRTALIVATGTDEKHQAYFANFFKRQLQVNEVIVLNAPDKSTYRPDVDAVISLDCFYNDYGQSTLKRSTDMPGTLGPKSATGVGKRIGCRLVISHKNLGTLFDGEIMGTTRLSGTIEPADFDRAIATSDSFSAFLEHNARQHFEAELKRSQGWFYVLNMKAQP